MASKTPKYKTCFVPDCGSTTVRTPEKAFVSVPQKVEIRRTWFDAARRNAKDFSPSSQFYCCEDHFETEDFSNKVKHDLTGCPLGVKENVVPTLFDCQLDRERSHTTTGRATTVAFEQKALVESLLQACHKQEEERKSLTAVTDSRAATTPAMVVSVAGSMNTSTSTNITTTNASTATKHIAPTKTTCTYTTPTRMEVEFSDHVAEPLQSLLLSSYYYGYVASQLFGGYMAQRFGGRLVFGPGVAITGVLTILTPVVAETSFTGLLSLRILEGCASGVVIPSLQSMFTHWYVPQERQMFSGFIFSSVSFGSLAGMGLSGLLIGWGGWRTVFYSTGALAVVWFVPWMLLAYDTPHVHPFISDSERNYIALGLGQTGEIKKKKAKEIPWVLILISPAVWAGILMQTGWAWSLYTLLNELPTYLGNVLHFSVKDSGLVSSLPYFFSWIVASSSGATSQWLRRKGYMSHLAAYRLFNGITAIGSAACFLGITFLGCNEYGIITLFILIMVCNGFLYGGSYMNHVDLSPNHAGAISGILHTIINTPGFITPVMTAAIIKGQHSQSTWANVFYVTIGVNLVTYVIYLMFGSVKEQSWNKWGVEEDSAEDKL